MKYRRTVREYRKLLLTNRVEFSSVQFQSVLGYVESGGNVPAVLVVRFESGFPNAFLIVDGNHRAVAHAYLRRALRYFEIRSTADIDKIIRVEAQGGFAGFPHRSFLTGDTNFEMLIHDTVVAAARDMKGSSALDVAREFRKLGVQ